MGKVRSMLCMLGLLLLIPALLQARRILPLDTHPLVAEKYAGWTGVLNLWVCEGWSSGISPWLNRCIASFEKAHPGVYVQPQFVDAGAVASMNDSGILPPDMVLFPPDLLNSPEGLMPLPNQRGVRTALAHCGDLDGSTYAVPVAIGGYLWAWNTALTDAIPDNWRDTEVTLSVPAPQPWRRWDAALLALCSKRYAPSDGSAPTDSTPPFAGEVELGLAAGTTPEPTPSPLPNPRATLPRRLPSGFQYDEDAWRHFINGESAAMPVTQREIRRLQTLSEQGKGPDWKLIPGDSAFTDQLLCLAIVDRAGADDRKALCLDLLAMLLTDECQSALCRASAFAVTDAPSGYNATDPLAVMDAALRDPVLCVPRMFDGNWATRAGEIVRKFTADTEEAPVLWGQLKHILAENTND